MCNSCSPSALFGIWDISRTIRPMLTLITMTQTSLVYGYSFNLGGDVSNASTSRRQFGRWRLGTHGGLLYLSFNKMTDNLSRGINELFN